MKRVIILVLIFTMLVFSGCTETPPEENSVIRVGGLTGPTSMGMVQLMSEADAGNTENKYEFSLQTEAGAFASALAKGETDIAEVPANMASIIYNNTGGGVKVIAVNTLGVLYIVERGDTVHKLSDLEGRTLYATGAGAAPEYALRYLMSEYGMDPDRDISVQWCADTTEALSYIISDENAVAMLPQPFVTVAQSKVEGLRAAIDLNEQWEKLGKGSKMVTGVLVARSEFAEQHPEELESFMEDYRNSVDFVVNDYEAAAELIGAYEIVPQAVALKALPYCSICCITGEAMQTVLDGYLNVLFELNPAAVGGKMPNEDFYYGT